jgi:hypothetical protein
MDLVQAIREELAQASFYYQQYPNDSVGWTRVTHEKIGNLASPFAAANGINCGMPTGKAAGGKRIEVSITGSPRPASIPGQFLFDQCWLTYYDIDDSPDNGFCTGGDLAVETERHDIGKNDFHSDFLKLVVSTANLKVMVFWTNRADEGEHLANELEKQAKIFVPGAECYLISYFCWEDKTYHHREIQI